MSSENYSYSSNEFLGPPPPFSYVAVSCAQMIAKVGVFIFVVAAVILSIVEFWSGIVGFGSGIANFLKNTYSELINFVRTEGYVWMCFCFGLFAASIFFWVICVSNKLSGKLPIIPFVCIGLACIVGWLFGALAVTEILTEPTTFNVTALILIWLPGLGGLIVLMAEAVAFLSLSN